MSIACYVRRFGILRACSWKFLKGSGSEAVTGDRSSGALVARQVESGGSPWPPTWGPPRAPRKSRSGDALAPLEWRRLHVPARAIVDRSRAQLERRWSAPARALLGPPPAHNARSPCSPHSPPARRPRAARAPARCQIYRESKQTRWTSHPDTHISVAHFQRSAELGPRALPSLRAPMSST